VPAAVLWSTALGNFGLARLLWLRCGSPLLTAMTARRVCLRLCSMASPAFEDELTTAADTFENWMLGILDQIDDAVQAGDLITAVPTRQEDPTRPDAVAGRVTQLWQGSVRRNAIPQASASPAPLQHDSDFILVGLDRLSTWPWTASTRAAASSPIATART
jgi:hypothetical protein